MTSVTFSASVGGDGSTVSDDSDPTTGLKDGGHRTRFVAALVQLVAVAAFVVTKAAEAAASALTAVNAPGTSATSTTSMSIGTGTKSFTLAQTGKSFAIGQTVAIARTSAAATTRMVGVITAFTSGSGAITVEVASVVGSGGPFTDWTIALAPDGAGAVSTSRQISGGGLATGGGTLAADRTITVTAAAATDVRTGSSTTTAVTPGALADSALPQTLTDGATINWNMATAPNAEVTLAGNRALAAPTSYRKGWSYAVAIIQDGTGSRTLTFNAAYDFGNAGAPTLSTGAGKKDMVFLYCYDATTPKFAATFWKAA